VGKLFQFLKTIFSACPYTITGKRFVGFFQDKKSKSIPTMEREQNLLDRVRKGSTIALIGFFCPFFWVLLFSGAGQVDVYFNAMHSGAVILIGIIFLMQSRFDLQKVQ